MDTYAGLKVIVSAAALTIIRNWPDKRRSKRLIKKMTKKYGPEVTSSPTSYQMGNTLIVHPVLYAELKRRSADTGAGFGNRL